MQAFFVYVVVSKLDIFFKRGTAYFGSLFLLSASAKEPLKDKRAAGHFHLDRQRNVEPVEAVPGCRGLDGESRSRHYPSEYPGNLKRGIAFSFTGSKIRGESNLHFKVNK